MLVGLQVRLEIGLPGRLKPPGLENSQNYNQIKKSVLSEKNVILEDSSTVILP